MKSTFPGERRCEELAAPAEDICARDYRCFDITFVIPLNAASPSGTMERVLRTLQLPVAGVGVRSTPLSLPPFRPGLIRCTTRVTS
jgi:hypothetical protein